MIMCRYQSANPRPSPDPDPVPQAVNVTLQYSLTDYSGGTCLEVAGHALSKGVIIVIVVIAVVAIIVLAILIKCCCFCL